MEDFDYEDMDEDEDPINCEEECTAGCVMEDPECFGILPDFPDCPQCEKPLCLWCIFNRSCEGCGTEIPEALIPEKLVKLDAAYKEMLFQPKAPLGE